MHKDLSDTYREQLKDDARATVIWMHSRKQSLALAREAWINAFDKAAEELDAA